MYHGSRTVTVFCRYHDNYISVVTGADQSGTEVGYKIVLPRSPWYLWLKTTLTLGLRPHVRVVYNHKSLATVVELLRILYSVLGGGGFFGQIIIALFPDLTPGNEAYVTRSRKGASPAKVHMWLCMFVSSKVSSS